MAQHDYNLINQSGASFRADLNNALAAIATNNSGTAQPSTAFSYEWWIDTASSVLKIRNSANSAWITTGISLSQSNTFTGNATTATTLQTARTINGVSFNGSANITFNTDSVAEGSSNLYFTTAKARASISATGDISYNSSTGVISFTGSSSDVTSVNTLTGAVVLTTANIGENTNLYFTDARARASISEGSTQLSYNSTTGVLTYTQGDTDTVSEGSNNLYYTSARANADFDTRLATKSTSNLAEGTNLYYTTSRFDSAFGNKTTANLSESGNLYFTDARARSAISATGDISYNSSTGVISFTQSTSPVISVNTLTGAVVLDTDDVAEGSSNLYFTNARADTRINLQTGANLDLSSKSTTNLSEGTNLYYTDARVQAVSINNVVEDTTPQLGGNLDLNSSNITGTGDINITGAVNLTNLKVSSAQGTDGQVLTSTGSGVAWEDVVGGSPSITDYSNGSVKVFTIYQGGGLDVNVPPSFPQGAAFYSGLFVNGYLRATDIRTHNNNNIEIDPNGSGVVVFKGNTTKGSGQFKLNCENNSHGITIKGAPHSAGADYTLTLPNDDGNANQVLTTDGSGVLSWSTPSSGGSTTLLGLTDVGSDGTNGQVLTTNGSGSFTFTTVSGGGSLNGLFATDIFTATSGQTAFTLSNSVSNENNLMVFVDGVFQAQNTYSTSGTTLTFATGIVLNRVVTVYHIETASGGGGSSGINVTKVSIASDQNIGRNTTTQLNFDTIEFGNSDSAFNTTTKKYTAPAAGTYQFTGRMITNTYNTSGNSTISLTAYIYKNNSTLIAMNQDYIKAAGSKRFITFFDDIVELAQGDVIDFRASMSNYAFTTDATIWTYDAITHMSIIKH